MKGWREEGERAVEGRTGFFFIFFFEDESEREGNRGRCVLNLKVHDFSTTAAPQDLKRSDGFW